MRLKNAEGLYPLYDHFINEFLLNGNSILTVGHFGILNEASLSNCFKNYIDNPDFDKGSNFDEKVKLQFKDADLETKLVFAHAEWLWAFAVDDIGIKKKQFYTRRTLASIDEIEFVQEVYLEGFGSAGRWHTNKKYEEISFVLQIIKFIYLKVKENKVNTLEQVKDWIEHICLYKKYKNEYTKFEIPETVKSFCKGKKIAMSNILTYVGKPDVYERIASNSHKNKIVTSFFGLLNDEEKETKNQDEKIFAIRQKLIEYTGNNFDFYEHKFKKVWNYSLTQEGFSEVQGLQYKKAIVLYGPPGTSKTYTATHLAKAIITNSFLSNKANVKEFFEKEPDITTSRIHHLQLHPNYTYEDFIAGYQLKKGETVKTKGTLFEICKKVEEDEKKLPHILILDEINRIDLSRLFGEVFSALENRDKPIEVGVGGFKLTIPSNLYVIGTMNEIDFSLERIDFALRRRFLWFFYGFKRDRLKKIIEVKNEKLGAKLKMRGEIDMFINNVSNLNKKITATAELGKQYQIGHTFFAEIVDIYLSYKNIFGYSSGLTKQLFRGDDGPVAILWKISIEPMLSSYLGNMELETRNEILGDFKNIFLNTK